MLNSLRPSTYVMGSNCNLGSFRVTGVKRSFLQKCYNSSMLHGMTISLIHVGQLETLYLCYRVKCQSGVIWGQWGQKGYFHQKCYNSSMLHSMTIRLMPLDQLETLYLCYGVKCQSQVIWGRSGDHSTDCRSSETQIHVMGSLVTVG